MQTRKQHNEEIVAAARMDGEEADDATQLSELYMQSLTAKEALRKENQRLRRLADEYYMKNQGRLRILLDSDKKVRCSPPPLQPLKNPLFTHDPLTPLHRCISTGHPAVHTGVGQLRTPEHPARARARAEEGVGGDGGKSHPSSSKQNKRPVGRVDSSDTVRLRGHGEGYTSVCLHAHCGGSWEADIQSRRVVLLGSTEAGGHNVRRWWHIAHGYIGLQ